MQTFSIMAYNLALYNFPVSHFLVMSVVHFFDWIQNHVAAHIIYLKNICLAFIKNDMATLGGKKMNVLQYCKLW